VRRASRLAALALLVGACAGDADRSADERPCALLVTLDTTRADALSCYGGQADTTPNLDELAAQGVLYEAAFTVAPLTQPSHASMLTGLYPPRHGIRDNGMGSLSDEALTLAELASEAGYETAAVVAAVVLDRAFGLAQGFDHYGAPSRAKGSSDSHIRDRPAGEVVDDALRWLGRRDLERPFFLWVHVFDPHAPYAPPRPFAERSASARELYRGEVAYVDRELGRLFDGLRNEGLWERTSVVVVADHGEAFGEHGEPTHGAYCYQATMRVPLILKPADRFARSGERSSAIVSVTDVFPTLAQAMGLGAPADVDGRSFLTQDPPDERGVYLESYSGHLKYNWSPLSGWVDRHGKYLHSSDPELYRWVEDPDETENVAAMAAAELERYRGAIAVLSERPALASGGGVDAQLTDALGDLGYAATGGARSDVPAPLAPSDLPAPHERREALRRGLDAQELIDAGRPADAEELLRRVLAENPDNWFALDRLATSLIQQERPEEAIAPLQRLVSGGPQWAGSWFNLGLCLQSVDRLDEAFVAWRRAVELEPTQPLFPSYLADRLREAGREEEARAVERAASAAGN